MAGRRGCVNSLWSGSERVRIGERLKATLAGIMELDLLRSRHLDMVDAALDGKGTTKETTDQQDGDLESVAAEGAAASRRQQVPSPSEAVLPCLGGTAEGVTSRWSTLSWDIPSELLSPPTPDPSSAALLDCDSRPSSGFYSVSGSSLSDSCYSVSSEATLGGPVRVGGPCRPHSADHSATQWREAEQQRTRSPGGAAEKGERRPVSTGDLEISGLLFLSDLCSSLGGLQQGSLFPLFSSSSSSSSSSPNPRLQLDPKFCSDLVSRKTKEVYPYPSPLHAVALQSPIFTSGQDPSPPRLSPSPESEEPGEPAAESPLRTRPPASPSLTQLEQYISSLAHQYHSRPTAESSSRGSRKRAPGTSHEATQPRTAFDSRSVSSTLTGGSVTPSKSLQGNSARVSLSSIGRKASRNSINLGNLPSVTGEDFNISFHLNLNLNLNPNLNKTLSLDCNRNAKEPVSGSCGYLGAGVATPAASTPAASPSSSFSATPSWRGRPRISTCPTTASHRGSLEIGGKAFGPPGFSRSLDWSGAREEAEGCPPPPAAAAPPGGSPKLSEDSAVVREISRVSGLPRAVVLSLMEEGVELDTDCFRSERELGEGASSPAAAPPSRSPLPTPSRSDCPGSRSRNPWAPSAEPGQDYGYQRCLRVSQPDARSVLAPRPGSPAGSDRSGPAPDPASSPASPRGRVRSPPRPLAGPPLAPAPLSVFRRDAPSQCSLPRFQPCGSPPAGPARPRGGSLRQGVGGEAAAGWRFQERGWRRGGDGERLYRGKHASRELVRASAASGYSGRDYGGGPWDDQGSSRTPKKGARFWKGFEGRLWGKEEDRDGGERDGAGGGSWRRSSHREQGQKETRSPKRKGPSWEGRSSSLRLSRRALSRSESQGFLEPGSQRREGRLRSSQWASSVEIAREGRGAERGRSHARADEGAHLSSTASLFHLSRSQSLEGSCHSISPLSSPSFSPSPPPPAPLTRSRSFRDLGRKVFGSMRTLSFKNQKSKK